jgi:multimeric flavodoxin WrbA
MARALILNGALAGDEALTPIEQSLSAALIVRGWQADAIHLRELSIAYCRGCFQCWVKTPGRCPARDCAGDVTRAIVQTDLLVLLSPITFGGYSSELKKALDRSIGIIMPFFMRLNGEVHHKARYGRYPALLGIGVSDGDEQEERTFSTLVARNAINFHAPVYRAAILRRGEAPGQMLAALARLVTEICRGAAA